MLQRLRSMYIWSKIEEYTKQFMDGHFDFDYSEYSRQNWAISNICCALDDALRKMLFMLFTDRTKLEQIKRSGE